MLERDPAVPDRRRPLTPLVGLAFFAQNVAIQSGFLDPPAAADLNGRNLSPLYEIVDSRERNPQVLGRLFYGKQIVNVSFAHSLGDHSIINYLGNNSYYNKRLFNSPTLAHLRQFENLVYWC